MSGRTRKSRIFMGDFETTVYDGQVNTEVWAAATVELYTENVLIFHSIAELFRYYISLKSNLIVYFHNLKFDGSFWLSFLMNDLHFKQATNVVQNEMDVRFLENKQMHNNTFKYSISDMGQWYTITIKVANRIIEIRDSLKLLPFSVKRIGKGFKTKHQKLEMEYKGFRYAGCEITDQEKEYIANDVLVVKEALEIMYNQGHNKLTIGACCMSEFKKLMLMQDYDVFFPNLYEFGIDEVYGNPTAGDYIRKSYRGGWCYLAKGKENRIYHNGTTADVNSLYPSMMHSESGNYYPVGKPVFWNGDYIPDEATADHRYFFVRIKTRFYLKPGKLPFIQLKGNMHYKGTESLETSDVYDPKTDRYYDHYYKGDVLHDTRIEMTLTMTDYRLLKDHYDLVDFEILSGCWFLSEIGIFDDYINKYRKMKMNNTGALRELAKLFLNNLYGKMAANTDSTFKYAYLKEDKSLGFVAIPENDKTPGYIAIGSAITSYARNFTIRAAQENYHGKDQPGFIYADTDSIHCDLPPEQITGIRVHDKAFCAWKLESCWDDAIFTRQKTYIEHVTHENLKPVEKPYYNIKCAGMPQTCKDLFEMSMRGDMKWDDRYKQEVKDFLFDKNHNPIKRDLTDFKVGLCVPGKLMPKQIRGGVLLIETSYEMR